MTSPLLIKIAREILKDLLSQCEPRQRDLFKQMYDFRNNYSTIGGIVDNLDTDKLDHAIHQCERTIENNNNNRDLPF
jgi:hypothetical protein